jgi:hypothetical protein
MSFKEVRVERRGLLDDIRQVSTELAKNDLSSELRMALTRNLLLFNKILDQLNELLRRLVRISLLEKRASVERAKLKRLNFVDCIKDNLKSRSLY